MLPTQPGAGDARTGEKDGRDNWLPCADGLRAVAALAVFVHHSSFLTGATWDSRAGVIFARLDIGVPIFFTLSGFLLARPYVAALFDDRALPDWRAFYRRRALRIIPAYWVALTATYVWLRPDSATHAHGLDYPLHYFLVQIYSSPTLFPKGISPAWSLAVEVTFYASLPLLALGAARVVRTRREPSQRAVVLLGFLGGLSVLSLALRTMLFVRGHPAQAVAWLPATFPQFAVGMAAAVLAAWAVRRPTARAVTDAIGRHDLLWWTAAVLLLLFQATQLGLERGLDRASWNREMLSEIIRILIAMFLLLPVAFGRQDRGVVRAALRSWPLATMGVISYGFFLWHVPLIEAAIRWTGRHPFLDWNKPGMGIGSADVLQPVGLALVVSIAAGALSWHLVEKPLLRRRRKVIAQAAP